MQLHKSSMHVPLPPVYASALPLSLLQLPAPESSHPSIYRQSLGGWPTGGFCMNPGHTPFRGPTIVLFVIPSSAGGSATPLTVHKRYSIPKHGLCVHIMGLLWRKNNEMWLHLRPGDKPQEPTKTSHGDQQTLCEMCLSPQLHRPSFPSLFQYQLLLMTVTNFDSDTAVVAPRWNREEACLWQSNNATYGTLWSNCKHPKYFTFNGKHAPSSRVWEAASKSH